MCENIISEIRHGTTDAACVNDVCFYGCECLQVILKVPTREKWRGSAGDKQLIISRHLGMYEYDLQGLVHPLERYKSAAGRTRPRGATVNADESHHSPGWDFLLRDHLDNGQTSAERRVPCQTLRAIHKFSLFV